MGSSIEFVGFFCFHIIIYLPFENSFIILILIFTCLLRVLFTILILILPIRLWDFIRFWWSWCHWKAIKESFTMISKKLKSNENSLRFWGKRSFRNWRVRHFPWQLGEFSSNFNILGIFEKLSRMTFQWHQDHQNWLKTR